MGDYPKLSYGLQKWDDGAILWCDTLKEAEDYIEANNQPCHIMVYGLSVRLTTITYQPYGVAAGYHYFGIHPDHVEMANKYGITDDVILEKQH